VLSQVLLVMPLLFGALRCSSLLLPVDCADLHDHYPTKPSGSGVYTIFPGGPYSTPLKVYCDMETKGGGWTVIQRRMDGTVNFNRPWYHYKKGFGNEDGEYWLGLENIYLLTRSKKYQLRVDMEDWEGRKVYALYQSFNVDPEILGYTLHLGGFINGGAGDSMSYHDGRKFSTYDHDQDSAKYNCAKKYDAAFWYGACFQANPNGVYRWKNDDLGFADGVEWYHFRGYDYSLKTISMKIRPLTTDTVAMRPSGP
ncbi:microfibril-associated glycoprotein 4-like, partial [Clupea harengus]|uniref:Microfibril-associated glycoprotein 4-like n=1 Tax=Clupea harengus TaxID=7950 RepID=A0A8M1K6L5_CLUHA